MRDSSKQLIWSGGLRLSQYDAGRQRPFALIYESGNPMRKFISSAALLALMLPGLASAGPVTEFKTVFSDVYASYRQALFTTNSGNAEKSLQALQVFDEKWDALQAKYADSPPPQYADDTLWTQTLDEVEASLEHAQREAKNSRLAQAHEALESVREAISALHARNQIETFSDRMNAYHAEMEHVLALDVTQMDPAMSRLILEHAAVLSYLAEDILIRPPVGVDQNNPEYANLARAFKGPCCRDPRLG